MKWIIIGWDNGLSPVQHQAIICISDAISSNTPLGTDFNEMIMKINQFSLTKSLLWLSVQEELS